MLRHISANATKIWKRYTVERPNGVVTSLCMIDLPKNRVDDLVDFKMKYYVPNEVTHKAAGLPNSVEAMTEYREYLRNQISDPTSYSVICCKENNNTILPDIIAGDTVKLIKRGDPYIDECPDYLKTIEARSFFKILRDWNDLYAVPDLMKRLDLPSFFEDLGAAVHPDYRGYGIAKQFCIVRRIMCQEYGVPMLGTWVTARGTEKGTQETGWELLYEISHEDLQEILKTPLESTIPVYKYMVVRG